MNRFLSWPGHNYILLLVRLYLAAIFLTACAYKIIHPQSFALDIATYQILPIGFVNIMAIVLPWIELAAGLMLLIGYRTRAGALLVAGMMLVFTVAIVIALNQGLDMSCGCFASQGAEEDPISLKTVFRDIGWLALSLYVFFLDYKPIGLDGWLMQKGYVRDTCKM